MATMKEHYVGLENTVMQRLKWAAGANPTLQTLIKQLTEALAENNKTIQVQYYEIHFFHQQNVVYNIRSRLTAVNSRLCHPY